MSYGIDFADVSWSPPQDDGGTPVTSYIVERKDVTRSSWIRVNEVSRDTLTCRAPKLVEGNEYIFRVSAVNDIDQGPATETTEALTAKCPFGKIV